MTSDSVGQIGLDLKINGKDYKKQVKQYGDYGSKQLEGSFSNTFKNIGKMAVGAFALAGITKFTASCLKLGSDLTEVQNVVDVAFPTMSKQINEFAQNAITQLGLSETVAKKYSGTFGAMAKAFNFTEKASADMAMELTGLAGDVASFYNMSSDEAYTKLKSVFTGETETLKELGVVMTQNALDQYALANGYGKTTAKMSEQEKVALRMKFVTDQLSLASGDFIRTQDSWANQTRVLSLRFDQLKASLGKGFIALFTPIVKGINWVIASLQPLADSFSSFFEMITGTSSSSGGGALADTSGDIAKATDGAGGLSDGLTDAGKSGEKAAKKINKAFSKVDTINKLTFGTEDDSGSEGNGTGGGSTGNIAGAVDFPKAGKQGNAFSGILDGILKEFKRLSGIFMSGFEIGFGNSFENIEKIKYNLFSIGDNIVDIFKDPKVQNAGRGWLDSLYKYWGTAIGSFSSIGVSIATLVTGSISKYLKQNTNFIKTNIVRLFNISEHLNDITGQFWVLLADIGKVFAGETASQIGSNFISAVVNGFIGKISLLAQIGSDIISCIITPLLENKDKIISTINGMLKPIEIVTGTISKGITDTFLIIGDTYEKYVAPAFANISDGLSNILGTVLDSYNKYIAPVIDGIAKDFATMWKSHIQPAINGLVQFFGKLAEIVGVVWKQFIAPFISWMVETFAPILAMIIENVWNKLRLFITFIADAIKAITDILSGICDFLTGVFTGDWEKIWTGLQEIFGGFIDFFTSVVEFGFGFVSTLISETLNSISQTWEGVWSTVSNFFGGIWDGICSGISTAINAVKDTINSVLGTIKGIWEGMWSGLQGFISNTWNNILGIFNSGGKIFSGVVGGIADVFRNIVNAIISGINDVISWPFNKVNSILNNIRSFSILGAKPFGGLWGKNPLPVPQIPMLAQGGYVGANQPQLAMIGDNRHQGEVIAPEDKMTDMINTALKMQKERGSINGLDTVIALIKQLIEAVKGLVLKVDIDMKKMSILLENAKKERQMIGG